MRALKIAFFIDAWTPGSGTENQLKGMLDRFDSDSVTAVLYTLRDAIPEDLRQRFPCPVHCLGVGSLLSPRAAGRFFSLVASLRAERFDIAMVYFVDTNLFVVPACRLAGIPNIVVNRRDMGYWYEKRLLQKLNLVNRLTDYFLVNSRAVKMQVSAHEGFPADRIQVIPNGMWNPDKDDSHPPADRAFLPDGVPAGAKIVGITASLRSVKRVDRFVDMAAEVAQRVPDAHFLIAGQGSLQAELRQQTRQLNLADRVHFLGQVADVRPLLATLDVGVLTSESEGLSNSLLEYARAGIPAVTFDTGGNREVVVDGRTGLLVPEGDTAALARSVIRLLDDQDLRLAMAQAGRRHAVRSFSAEKIMDQIMEFFTGGSSAPRRSHPCSAPTK